MTTAALTEERLRSWLDGNQPQRERLCIAVLSLQPGFSDVRPRRPKGGPDGGRDIEAVFDQRVAAFGAVGFRNGANDSGDDKRWVSKKFRDDLEAALVANPDLQVFVFFTNVDLTPSECDALVRTALGRGLRKVEVFYRERLRICLDSPTGLAFRFQYLGVELSSAEQAAFFGTFGQQLEELLIRQFGSVELRLQRLEFLQEARKPLTVLRLIVELDRPLTPEELGHYRMMVEIIDLSIRPDHPTLWLGGRDAYAREETLEGERTLFAYKQLGWTRSPDDKLQDTVIGVRRGPVSRLLAATGIHGKGPFQHLADLERKSLNVFMTRPLAACCRTLVLMANSYVLFAIPAPALVFLDCSPLANWPEELKEHEREVRWSQVFMKGRPGSELPWERQRPFSLDFDQITPQKIIWGDATF